MASIEQSMQSYYAARAPEYDSVYRKPERQADLLTLQRWLPPRFAGRRVLEVACGTGFWTRFIAPVAADVVALDTSAETIAVARQRVAENSVRFVVGDAYALPMHFRGFGAAFAGFWLSHVPKPRRRTFLAGLNASLEPGAVVVLLDNLYVHGSNHPISERDAEGNTYQLRTLADGSPHKVLKNFPSELELLEAVDGLGERPVYTKLEYFWALQYVIGNPRAD